MTRHFSAHLMGIKMANPLLIRDIKLYSRIMEHVDKNGSVHNNLSPCWEWKRTGSTTKMGYGVLSIDGNTFYTHILIFKLFKDNNHDQSTKTIRHKCDNRSCCNPKHLESGNQVDNVNDMWERNRAKPQGKKPMTYEQYKQLIQEYNDGIPIYKLSEKWNRDRSTVSGIVHEYYEPYLKLKKKHEKPPTNELV